MLARVNLPRLSLPKALAWGAKAAPLPVAEVTTVPDVLTTASDSVNARRLPLNVMLSSTSAMLKLIVFVRAELPSLDITVSAAVPK